MTEKTAGRGGTGKGESGPSGPYQVPVDQEPAVVRSLPHAVPSPCGSRARCRLFIIACPYQVPVDQEPAVVRSLPRAVPSPCGSRAHCRVFITACCTKSLWIKSPGCRLLIIACRTKFLSVDQEPVVCSLSHAVPSPCGSTRAHDYQVPVRAVACSLPHAAPSPCA